MDEVIFGPGSVPVAVAARVFGKDACWVRAGIITGYLNIGTATRNAREIDTDLKVQQMKADAKDRKIKYAISIGETVVSTAVIIWGTLKSFKFEENGTITTIMGRGFINKLLPKK